MSIQNSVVKNRCGECYKIQLPREINAQLTLKPMSFWNEGSAQQFISNLNVENNYWRDIIHQYSTMPCPSSLTSYEIEKQVSTLMIQGQLKFYPVEIPDIVEHPPEKRVIKSTDNVTYQFVPVSTLLLTKTSEIKTFKNVDEAKEFLSGLNANDEQLTTIANELDIKLPATASVNKGETTEAVSQELAAGNIVIIVDKTSSVPATKKETLNKSDVGNRVVILADKKQDNTQNKNICSCSVEVLESVCSHNRSSSSDNLLQIVASTDRSHSEEYELMGIKVTLKKEFGGVEEVTCTTSLKDNQSTGCFQITDVNNKYITSNETVITIKNEESDTNSKWPINASPKKFTISSRGCDNKVKTTRIEKFPNHYFTVEANVSIFQDWVKNVNKAWQDWGSKIFDISPVEITPKLTGPAGSFSANWGWKEDTNWKAYYNVSANFGLKPLFGVEVKIMVSMTKLALTSTGVPPNFAKLAAEHLADIQVSSTGHCKGTLTGSPKGKFYPDGTKKITGEGKFTVEGGVNLELLGRVGSDYVISAELSISGESKVTAEDLLELNSDGIFLQSTLMLSPLIGLAKVKIRYLKIRTKTKEKKWEPWKQIELYKSENKKILPRS